MDKTTVEVSTQVVEFMGTLAPEPRKRLREALRKLAREEGDICALEANLDGFYRLRVGSFRVIFFYAAKPGHRIIRCVFAERRSIIYQTFAQLARQVQK